MLIFKFYFYTQVRLSLQSHTSPVTVTQKLNVYATRIAIVFHTVWTKKVTFLPFAKSPNHYRMDFFSQILQT